MVGCHRNETHWMVIIYSLGLFSFLLSLSLSLSLSLHLSKCVLYLDKIFQSEYEICYLFKMFSFY